MHKDIRRRIVAVRDADSENFKNLVELSGLNPVVHFRHSNLSAVVFSGSNLDGFDFSGANISGCDFRGSRYQNARFDYVLFDSETIFENGRSPSDFLNNFVGVQSRSMIFLKTPKGDDVRLPVGSTVLDFAYHIHSEIGARAVSALVEKTPARLNQELHSGETVEIIVDDSKAPNVSELEIVSTRRAKAYLKRALRDQKYFVDIERGKADFEKFFKSTSVRNRRKVLNTAASRLGFGGETSALLGAFGAENLGIEEILLAGISDSLPDGGNSAVKGKFPILGLSSGQKVTFCRDCCPLPNSRIVGIAIRGTGILVHQISCFKLEDHEQNPERWLDLAWQAGVRKLI